MRPGEQRGRRDRSATNARPGRPRGERDNRDRWARSSRSQALRRERSGRERSAANARPVRPRQERGGRDRPGTSARPAQRPRPSIARQAPRRERAGPLFETHDQRWPDVGRILARQPWPALETLVDAEPRTETVARLKRFVELLLQWNKTVSNLISQNDEERIVAAHLAPSLEPAGWIRSHDLASWVDFGSGGGFPAIPLMLCGVGRSWDLVESRRTKTLFLRRAVDQLSLAGTSVLAGRLEDLVLGLASGGGAVSRGATAGGEAPESGATVRDALEPGASVEAPEPGASVEAPEPVASVDASERNATVGETAESGIAAPRTPSGDRGHLRAPFDGFTSRATMALGPTLRLARPIVRPGGAAFLWKGSRLDEELAEARSDLAGWREAERRTLVNGQTTVIKLLRTEE